MNKIMRRLMLNSLLVSFMFLFNSSINAGDFDGISWISISPQKQSPNQWLCFRKLISVNKNISGHVYMNIAVDSKYWLWINNQLVVFEGGLKRGPNPKDTYYDTIDISKYLLKGDNVISILVWYWGRDGFCHKDSGKSGLLAKISLNNSVICTDSSWKVRIHPAFGETGNPKPNYRLPESNIYYDARLQLGNWKDFDYDDTSWEYAVELGKYPCMPWNLLHERPFPNWKESGIKEYDELTKVNKCDTLVVVGKLPKNITVTPYIKIKAVAGEKIDIRSDNYRGGSAYNVRAEYVTKDGTQEFEMLNYLNGHNIIYTLPKGVKFLKAGYRETRFNTEFLGKFQCNDNYYNILWEKSLNTMNLNMRDAIQDPDRERSQWWGDAAIISNEIYYTCDKNGLLAVKKAILNLVDWQKENGVLYSPVPAGSWDKELPLQMLASIGKFGFWKYYEYTADLNIIRYIYPKVKSYLALWNIDEDGLVKHRPGGWDWADWGDNIDVEILDNAWYCIALEAAINMARLLNDKLFLNYYSSQLKLVRDASIKAFWRNNFFRSEKYKGITDDRANGLALLVGFSDDEKERRVVDFLSDRMGASPYMEKYILEALFSKGYIEEALLRMKYRYSNMVNSSLTTLWEDWKVGGAGGGSINHGWAGGALSLLPQYVAGIYPYEAGWDTIMVKPQLGHLEWIDCSVPIQNSIINVKVKHIKNEKYQIDVNNSSSKPCIVAFPKKYVKTEIFIDNVMVTIQNIERANNSVCFYGSDNKYFYFSLKKNKLRISNIEN